jgi:glyceraldehyde-3-phosphate dehydrogenase (NAD(P))
MNDVITRRGGNFMKVRVGVNGYGTIGKRAAWAVSKQDDMEVVGVTKTRPSFEARTAIQEGFPGPWTTC